jgi:hypothetical protein
MARLAGREAAQALDDPALVLALTKFLQRASQFLDVLKHPAHSSYSFSVRMSRSTQALHSGWCTNDQQLRYTHQPQHRCKFALRPDQQPRPSRRFLLAHTHLLVIFYSFSSPLRCPRKS